MEEMPKAELQRWRAVGWVAVLVFLSFGAWWCYRIPTAGKGGLLLAMGATLMPLFWDKAKVACKMTWVAMLFVLLLVEYRAIDKEHAEATKAQQDALKEMGDGFQKVLRDQETSFSTLIQTSQANFKNLIESEQQHFERNMAGIADTIQIQTGSDSVCYLHFVGPGADITVTNLGKKFSLRSVRAHVVDTTRVKQLFKIPPNASNDVMRSIMNRVMEAERGFDLEIGDVPVHTHDIKVGEYFPPGMLTGDTQEFEIEFTGLNGYWHESFRLRKVPYNKIDTWVSAYKVRGPYTKNAQNKELGPYKDRVIEYADPPYPRVNGKIDWSD